MRRHEKLLDAIQDTISRMENDGKLLADEVVNLRTTVRKLEYKETGTLYTILERLNDYS